MLTTPRPLVALMVAGSVVAGAGAAAIRLLNDANGLTDAGRRPAFGTDGARRGVLRSPAVPVALSAPSIMLRAAVVPVGVDETGAMALPDDVSYVGWYQYGPRPGSAGGSAVLAGHVDSRERGTGPLASLHRVSPGDRLTVRLADGREVGYRVVSREVIERSAMPLNVFFARDGLPRLTVITCGGPFDAALGHYRDNIVITAVPVHP
ncbi:Sortase family protein [Thermomonospora echinospora]|uniref:Sortase family protein n=1 Tax=Thermomonospora echinospora TaxID=1992 RepID=A0A1H6DFU4_9ACTN|nr:class F sortase [Thermomonospora echinospora]SEG83962.1 Sortase family protein [Thermomonospora echinospora]